MKKLATAKAFMNFLYKTPFVTATEVSALCFNKYSPAEAKVIRIEGRAETSGRVVVSEIWGQVAWR